MASTKMDPTPDDLPSDFFDDFDTDMFVEGLSVIDSWKDEEGVKRKVPRIDAEAVENVKDLRDLIRDTNNDRNSRDKVSDRAKSSSKKTSTEWDLNSHLDSYIKPGSRRDLKKTNEAIKKDKEIKVKEYLAKSIEGSTNDLRPPGTELDDFYDEKKKQKKARSPIKFSKEPEVKQGSQGSNRDRRHQHSPRRHYSPRRHSPGSYQHQRHRRYSPGGHGSTGRHRTPTRKRNPFRLRSPIRSHQIGKKPSYEHRHGTRSPEKKKASTWRRSPDSVRSRNHRDNFLYPRETAPSDLNIPFGPNYAPHPWEANPPSSFPNYAYSSSAVARSGPPYAAGYKEFPGPPGVDNIQFPHKSDPQPVPAPVGGAVGSAPLIPGPAPPMVPGPALRLNAPPLETQTLTPYDALAQLLADGKISMEDYLKLAPSKSLPSTTIDVNEKDVLLSRCQDAFNKLTKLQLPNRLVIHANMGGMEPKCLAPKYCSPLKRQPPVVFPFTAMTHDTVAKQNKQLLESIVATIGLEEIINKNQNREAKNTKDVAVQTSRPFCEICEIRQATQMFETGTSVERKYLTCSVHTQVLEEDLVSSKAMFNPTGSVGEGATMSIAHMTPAQLVSQLAARAKTLKQDPAPDPPSYPRRPPDNYSYGGSANQYNNYNYRY